MDNWIEECLKIVESDKIRWFLNEIKQLISRKFYERSSFMDHDKVIIDLLLNDRAAFSTAVAVSNNIGTVKERLVKNYLLFIHEKLKEGMLEYETHWEIDEFDDRKSGSPYWTPIVLRNKDRCGISIAFGFDKSSFRGSCYGIINDAVCEKADEGEKHEYAEEIKGKAMAELSCKCMTSPFWPCYVVFNKFGDDWLHTDWAMKLSDFKFKQESSALFGDAKIIVERMLALLKMLDGFFKEKSGNK
jgi:hypothetical protein